MANWASYGTEAVFQVWKAAAALCAPRAAHGFSPVQAALRCFSLQGKFFTPG